MDKIENFIGLPFEEQKKFAETLVKTINTERTFTSDVDFKLFSVEEDISGGLIIVVEHDGLIEVPREATWQCSKEDEIHEDPGYSANYTNYVYDEAKKAFKTLSAEIEGYKVSLEVDDITEKETVEVNVDDYSHEDSGVGWYEYGSEVGYDSDPYIQVEGTIVKGCDCALSLYVEPIDEPVEVDEEDNSLDGDFDPDGRRAEKP